MEPRVQYARTKDGVSIACWAMGEGPPLVWMGDAVFSHVLLEWHIPECRSSYESLISQGRKLIRFDQRGGGLSDRNVSDLSLEGRQADLEAVVDRLGVKKFDLFAFVDSGPPAMAFAARNPDRVSHLMLWCTSPTGGDYADLPQIEAVRGLRERDWPLYTETIAHFALGWSAGEPVRRAAELMREAFTPETLGRIYQATADFDATAYLTEIRVPTLVLHRRGVSWLPDRGSRQLASEIADARLAILDGNSLLPSLSDWDLLAETLDEFLQSDTGRMHQERRLPSGTAVILFADIADSTALTERLGDAAFRAKARDLDTALREVIGEHAGTAIEGKLLGDGVLAVFTSARQAIEAALACGSAGVDAGLPLHLGLHAGDVIREEGNVYGGAVNIASRISGLSAPGEMLVSETVRALARTSAGVKFEDRGEQRLRGVSDAVRVWAVNPTDASRVGELPRGQERAYPDHLTSREIEVLRLIAAGRTNLEISRELVLSLRTVARHITNIYGKIGARSKVDATSYAIRHHLTPD